MTTSQEVIGTVQLGQHGQTNTDIPVELYWDEEDPFYVVFTFHNPGGQEVDWDISRDLLIEALMGEVAGEMDVILSVGAGLLCMILTTPDGQAVITFNAREIEDFIEETLQALDLGEEDVEGALEDFLDDVLDN